MDYMLTFITVLLAALLFPCTLSIPVIPYPFPNSTTPINATASNATDYVCHYGYPSDLTVLNERYPDHNESRLHDASTLFMLRRQVPVQGEIATRVQFTNLPPWTSHLTCRLEFVLPAAQFMMIQGFNPSFNVYQVERDTESISTWREYIGNDVRNDSDPGFFGRMNGEAAALDKTRSVGGVAAINQTACNDTLTFQMGLAYNSKDGVPNYWEFTEVIPPAWPMQGFRMVWGC
ncbi:hypothetical protein ACEQ8H_007551 [Pleosporales sp. CAS-2024a]